REGRWDREALALAGIGPERLSAIVPTTAAHRGPRDAALAHAGIAAETACVIGASDGVLANLGVGAISGEAMVVTIGTSCAVRTGSARPITDPATRPFCYVLDTGRYIVGGPSNSGGIVLDWLYHKLLSGDASTPARGASGDAGFGRLLAAAANASADDLLVLPYVAGERAPLWNAHASAACVGLRSHHTAAHVMRAAIEGLLLNAYWIASGLFTALGRPQRLLASGKVLEPLWIRQLAADIFGLPVVYRGAVDASVVGAAALAEIATGARTWEAAAGRAAGVGEAVTPPAEHARYQRTFTRFRRLAEVLAVDGAVPLEA
ncbi:MAG: gluconate kinase, partial [Ktedonobacterales bacterium]|nr:gluconate kinase [Ktedonobacterales bacterium]